VRLAPASEEESLGSVIDGRGERRGSGAAPAVWQRLLDGDRVTATPLFSHAYCFLPFSRALPRRPATARASMFKIHLGDTPHNLTPEDFKALGALSEGMSGSDIGVVVREALMEPLRKCRTAKFFRKDRRSGLVRARVACRGRR
jgi:hypothetical protein